MNTKVLIKQTRLFQTLNHWRKCLINADYLQKDRRAREDFDRFCNLGGGLGLRQNLRLEGGKPNIALIVRNISLPYAALEAVMMKAFQMAGFETVVLGSRQYDFLRYDWLARSQTAFTISDFDRQGDPEWVDKQVRRLSSLQEWLGLEYQGVHVGRFTIASTLRHYKVGHLDFTDPAVRATLKRILNQSVHQTLGAVRLFDKIGPECVFCMDRGYSGVGEVFDIAINRRIDTMTWNLGYKSNSLLLKRYNSDNQREHPNSLSTVSWRRLCSIPWNPENGHSVREELFQCYQQQDWFSMVGTQFDKEILSRQMTRQTLGLSSDKKVAVIFPHILWDGSFFFGKDLFDDYTQWFVETIRAASANTRIQWVVKIHPANLVKAKQQNDQGKPAELNVIEGVFGSLPDHVKLVFPETGLSTFSLFEIADYAVTVRGTVGIEAALFGVPVVTAGTGRYDRRGFTLDSNTRQEYLHKLETLENIPRLSKEQIEIAERYAYGIFFCRPLRLSSVSLEYARDGKATPKVTVHCQTRQQWLASPDMRQLADWIADGKAEDMLSMEGLIH